MSYEPGRALGCRFHVKEHRVLFGWVNTRTASLNFSIQKPSACSASMSTRVQIPSIHIKKSNMAMCICNPGVGWGKNTEAGGSQNLTGKAAWHLMAPERLQGTDLHVHPPDLESIWSGILSSWAQSCWAGSSGMFAPPDLTYFWASGIPVSGLHRFCVRNCI